MEAERLQRHAKVKEYRKKIEQEKTLKRKATSEKKLKQIERRISHYESQIAKNQQEGAVFAVNVFVAANANANANGN